MLRTLREAALEGPYRGLIGRVEAVETVDYGVTYTAELVERDGCARPDSEIRHAVGATLPRYAPDEGIQLTVTSPPYLNAIDYDPHAFAATEDWSEMAIDDRETAAWYSEWRAMFDQIYVATPESGYCAVVVGTVKRDKN